VASADSVPRMAPPSRVAFVTGASQGIGRVVAAHLAAAGYKVAAAARSTRLLQELSTQTGALAVELDVTDAQAVADAVTRVESELGPIDLLVNNAGFAGQGGVSWDHQPTDWWRVFEVNVLGTFLCCRAVLPSMVSRRSGRIVNLSSGAALFPIDDDFGAVINSAYLASKAAVIRFSEALAAETRPAGVTVLSISPGTVKTGMTTESFADLWDDEDIWSPPELAAELIEFIDSGALDQLSGRYIRAAVDDWRALPAHLPEIIEHDLHSMRLRTTD
jgi:3-oxoacyl-[acyl-carrier protein] reductase